MAAGALVVLVLALGLAGGLVLYWLVRAERAARRDAPDRDDR